MTFDSVIDTYEFGWNITRSVLKEKGQYREKTIFGDFLLKKDKKGVDLRRQLESERLHHKYTKMLYRKEKPEYCRGALDLIEQWDIIGVCPDELETFEDHDEGEYDEFC